MHLQRLHCYCSSQYTMELRIKQIVVTGFTNGHYLKTAFKLTLSWSGTHIINVALEAFPNLSVDNLPKQTWEAELDVATAGITNPKKLFSRFSLNLDYV